MTALTIAAQSGYEQVALVLLEAKADPNKATPNGVTALMFAAQNGHEQVVVLLKAGAD
jgi:ankyrin repeat protein